MRGWQASKSHLRMRVAVCLPGSRRGVGKPRTMGLTMSERKVGHEEARAGLPARPQGPHGPDPGSGLRSERVAVTENGDVEATATITAGNASQLSDGASAAVLRSRRKRPTAACSRAVSTVEAPWWVLSFTRWDRSDRCCSAPVEAARIHG